MNGAASEERQKTVRVIPPKVDPILAKLRDEAKQLRTVAYCRVSTKQEEQLNSYDTQVKYYTEKINAEPKWKFAGIYADKGISGTSVKKRDEFNRMIRACKRGAVDLILTKSISRFARNTVDCLKYVRLLRELNVDVYFEEQGIHSNQPGAEFYITIYGSLAQSESENISANVRWGKEQSAKQGKVIFQYQSLLGYRRGADGQPEIDEKEAETVRLIYRRYLMGDSLRGIADRLEHQGILSPKGKSTWDISTIRSILSNEKYKGDAILNKTYTVDCISKKVRQNNGERPMYYVEHNHPAIIDPDTFGRVQEELARRAGKPKTKQVGTQTEMGKYSSKYALTDLLVCGECGTPYRRCTWTAGGKRIVWRCISRLDYGKRKCQHSPTLEEGNLQEAIMEALLTHARESREVLQTLKTHIRTGLEPETDPDETMTARLRIAEIDRQFQAMLAGISAGDEDSMDETAVAALMQEKRALQDKLIATQTVASQKAETQNRLKELSEILDTIQSRPMPYDDSLVRQTVAGVIVDSKEQIRVVFKDGVTVVGRL